MPWSRSSSPTSSAPLRGTSIVLPSMPIVTACGVRNAMVAPDASAYGPSGINPRSTPSSRRSASRVRAVVRSWRVTPSTSTVTGNERVTTTFKSSLSSVPAAGRTRSPRCTTMPSWWRTSPTVATRTVRSTVWPSSVTVMWRCGTEAPTTLGVTVARAPRRATTSAVPAMRLRTSRRWAA